MTDPDSIPVVLPADLGTPVSGFREVPWQRRDLIIGLGVPLLGLVAMVVLRQMPRDWLTALPLVVRILLLVAGVLLYIGMGLFPLWLARRRQPGFTWRWPGLGEFAKELGLAMLLLPGLWIVLGVALRLWSLVSSSQPEHSLVTLSEQMGPHPVLILLLIVAFTLAPVLEELYFRAFLYNALARTMAIVPAALLQAVIFGLFHPFNVIYVLVITIMGLFLAAVYEWRQTLLAPIFIHGLHNFVAALAAAALMLQAAHAPLLGVNTEADPQGCRITQVLPGTAAETAGLQVGDIIQSVEDEPVATPEELRRLIRQRQIGDRIRIALLRGGMPLEVDTELQARLPK